MNWSNITTTNTAETPDFDGLLRVIDEFRAKCPPVPEIRESSYAVRRPWVFPRHQFFEWDAKDEALCRRFGIGHEGPSEPCILKLTHDGKEVWYVHPSLMDAIRRQAGPTAFLYDPLRMVLRAGA